MKTKTKKTLMKIGLVFAGVGGLAHLIPSVLNFFGKYSRTVQVVTGLITLGFVVWSFMKKK